MKPLSKLRVVALAAIAATVAVYPMATMAAAVSRVFDRLHGWITQPAQVSYKLNANTLDGIIPTLYQALNVVSREMVGFIPAVSRNSNAERAAINQTVRVPIGTAGELEDIVPGVNPANTGDTGVGYTDIVITKAKAAPVRWNGEEVLAVGSNGTYNQVLADQFQDAMRKLVNAVELDLSVTAFQNASRAHGVAGTAPFGTAGDLGDFAGVLQILEDNGAPKSDLQLVLGSAAMANLRGKQSVLFKVNEAGSNDMLRNGMTDRVQSFALRNSGAIAQRTKGTGAAYVTSGATAVGANALALATGTGTVLAGDVVTFAADTSRKYVVNKGVAAPGTITIGKPGARVVIPTGNAMTIGASYTPNVAFARGALVLASRAPALPVGGDSADDSMFITDPVTGLVFEVRVYRQYRQVKYEVCLAWGTASVNGEHIATLMG